MRIVVIHGPNLNLLGTREPDIYGSQNLAEINQRLAIAAAEENVELRTFQSNGEGEIVNAVQEAGRWGDGLLINAAAYTHTSLAIPDAITATGIPTVEVHISNVYAREPFRHHSHISPLAKGVVIGFGWRSYLLGFKGLVDYLKAQQIQPADQDS